MNETSNQSYDKEEDSNIEIVLIDQQLWRKFDNFVNEMIVTKNGRRMFPVLKVSVSGLEPTFMYSVVLDFAPVGNNRWKYVNGEWVPGGKPEPFTSSTAYVHPDSPNFGSHWTKQPINFSRVKLTNKASGNSQQVMLNSLHKYEPRIHIMKISSAKGTQKMIFTRGFPETRFIAVTAYQNEDVTSLKIKYNPFAKAFLDVKESRADRDSYFDVSSANTQSYANSGGRTISFSEGLTRSENQCSFSGSPFQAPHFPLMHLAPPHSGFPLYTPEKQLDISEKDQSSSSYNAGHLENQTNGLENYQQISQNGHFFYPQSFSLHENNTLQNPDQFSSNFSSTMDSESVSVWSDAATFSAPFETVSLSKFSEWNPDPPALGAPTEFFSNFASASQEPTSGSSNSSLGNENAFSNLFSSNGNHFGPSENFENIWSDGKERAHFSPKTVPSQDYNKNTAELSLNASRSCSSSSLMASSHLSCSPPLLNEISLNSSEASKVKENFESGIAQQHWEMLHPSNI